MHTALIQSLPGRRLNEMRQIFDETTGEIQEMRVVDDEYDNCKPKSLRGKLILEGENGDLDARATFMFTGLQAKIVAFEFTPAK